MIVKDKINARKGNKRISVSYALETSNREDNFFSGIKNYIAAGVIGIGSLFTAPGCRTPYEKPSEKDWRNLGVYQAHRSDNYSRPESEMKSSALGRLESIDNVVGLDEAVGKYSSVLGENEAKLAGRLKYLGSLARNAALGADSSVIEIYNSLNRSGNGKLEITPSQAEKLKRSYENMETLRMELSGENSLSYSDLIALQSKADSLKDGGMKKDLEGTIDNFKNNMREISIREGVKRALRTSERLYGKDMLYGIAFEDKAEGLSSGIRYSEVAPEAIIKSGLSVSLEKKIIEMGEYFRRDESIDPDFIVRNLRHNAAKNLWRGYASIQLDGKEAGAGIWDLDRRMGEEALRVGKAGGWEKFGKRLLWFAVPLGPGYKAVEALSHMGAPDTVDEFAIADRSGFDRMKAALDEVQSLQMGMSNLNHVVGDKGSIMGDGVLYLIQQGAQAAIVVGIVNAAGGFGGGSSSSSSAGSSGGSGGAATPPGPVDW